MMLLQEPCDVVTENAASWKVKFTSKGPNISPTSLDLSIKEEIPTVVLAQHTYRLLNWFACIHTSRAIVIVEA